MKDSKKWQFTQYAKIPKLNNPVFIEGLPGIGNVGKVAIDFLIDELQATRAYEITSYAFPHSVFVNEDNLVELPIVEIFYKKMKNKKQDLILLSGDVQPVDEESSYEFSDIILDLLEKWNVSEIITTGGIGLGEIPKNPKVYCTGNSKKMIKRYKSKQVNDQIFGVVGPIVGVSGLLVGLAAKRNMEAVAFLAETYGHPMYLGIRGAREILKVLDSKLELGIELEKLDKEIKNVESEISKKAEQISNLSKTMALKRFRRNMAGGESVDYIG